MINLTKHQFKICEAVQLGLRHYYMGPHYMGPHDRRELTVAESKEAALLLPVLPKGWMLEEQDWMKHKIPKRRKKHEG